MQPIHVNVAGEPEPIAIDLATAAVLIIDMQRDILEPGGFGAALGNDVARLRSAIGPCERILELARRLQLPVLHTREGHRADMNDVPAAKLLRGKPRMRIGDAGTMGRILIRGEPGHAIIPELAPREDEPVVDKPGKGAFYATDLEAMLRIRGIDTLFVCGVTTEICVHTTVREANDRGFRCIVLSDCTASYFPEFHDCALRMISAQGGILGWVADSIRVAAALNTPTDSFYPASQRTRP
jgi:nicotinamidase-related amidase